MFGEGFSDSHSHVVHVPSSHVDMLIVCLNYQDNERYDIDDLESLLAEIVG